MCERKKEREKEMRLEAIEFAPVTSELTSVLPKSTCNVGENSCWSSSSASYCFHLAGTKDMPEVPITMVESSEQEKELQGESSSRKGRRRGRRRRRKSFSSSRHSCSFHHKVPLVSSSTCSSSLVQREEDFSDEEDIEDGEDEEMKKEQKEKNVTQFTIAAASSYFTFDYRSYGSFLFSLMISLNLWIKDCSAKGTGVIGAAAGGSDSGGEGK